MPSNPLLLLLSILYYILGVEALETQAEPATFLPNPSAGGGGSRYKDSPRFRVYNTTDAQATGALKLLESAYTCFVEDLGWRSSGLSYNLATDTGPYYKLNAYGLPSGASIGGAGGVMSSDARTGQSFIKIVASTITQAQVTVHEYGHSLTYYERTWVDQGRTGAWWETVAQYVAETFMNSPLCEKARKKYNVPEGRTMINLVKVIGSSHQVLVDGTKGSANNIYDAWPFLTYITNNPDGYKGLGRNAVRDMFRKYKRKSNETPFHVLERVSEGASVQKVVGRYWARMAYVDIGSKQAQQNFGTVRTRINYANLDSSGSGSYRVKAARQPRYMGANIIPLKGRGAVTVKVTSTAPFTATLAIRSKSVVRYVDLPGGVGNATMGEGSEATLVVANTPATLYIYDAFAIRGEAAKGLDYQVRLTGATA
jgi:hypothetical protein